MRSPRGTTLEAALRATLAAETTSDAGGAVNDAGGAPYATDGGELERAGIASMICGPGELEQAHQPDESIARAAFEAGTATIHGVVRRLCCD
jgi:acetylornithine deacetylase